MEQALCVNLFNTVNDIIFVYKDVFWMLLFFIIAAASLFFFIKKCKVSDVYKSMHGH